jgi:hypothetical protein
MSIGIRPDVYGRMSLYQVASILEPINRRRQEEMIVSAWHIGAFAGLAFAGKLPKLEEVMADIDKPPPPPEESLDDLKELAKSKGMKCPW